MPLQDCLLRSAPSPASFKHNSLEGSDEGDGVINRYLAESDRKPISGRRASNRTGTALPSGSNRAGNNKFRLRRQKRRWTCVVEQESSHRYELELSPQCSAQFSKNYEYCFHQST